MATQCASDGNETSPSIRSRHQPPSSIILIISVAVISGYWLTLPRVLPQWQELLTQIQIARENVETLDWLAGKPAAFAARRGLSPTDYVVGLVALILLYIAKIVIVRRTWRCATKLVLYAGIISLITPYLYIRWEDWENPHVYFVGNWLGTPVTVLFVPTVSFFIDLASEKPSLRWLIGRSAFELVIAMPIWTAYWCYFSFIVLQFGWI